MHLRPQRKQALDTVSRRRVVQALQRSQPQRWQLYQLVPVLSTKLPTWRPHYKLHYTGCWHLGAAEAGVRADEALLADVEAPQPQLAAALATLHLAHCQPRQLGGVARGLSYY